MQAVETRYHGPTNHRGSRVSVRWAESRSLKLFVAWDHALNVEENHRVAFEQWLAANDRTIGHYDATKWHCGGTQAGYAFVFCG